MTTMNEIVSLLKNWTESGSTKGPEFKSFCRKFKSAFTQELNKINAKNIIFSFGHYYISGFFTVNSQCYYFSISDVRAMTMEMKLLFRTAKDYKDYTGGMNRYVKLEKDMCLHMGISTNEIYTPYSRPLDF
jgi:hypothetical protein